MASFFDGLLDIDAICGELEDVFPLRVAVTQPSTTISATGGLVSNGDQALAGMEAIPAQYVPWRPEQVSTTGADHELMTDLWTLLGAWPQVPVGSTLVEVGSGKRHQVLSSDVNAFDIHTDVRTHRMTQ